MLRPYRNFSSRLLHYKTVLLPSRPRPRSGWGHPTTLTFTVPKPNIPLSDKFIGDYETILPAVYTVTAVPDWFSVGLAISIVIGGSLTWARLALFRMLCPEFVQATTGIFNYPNRQHTEEAALQALRQVSYPVSTYTAEI